MRAIIEKLYSPYENGRRILDSAEAIEAPNWETCEAVALRQTVKAIRQRTHLREVVVKLVMDGAAGRDYLETEFRVVREAGRYYIERKRTAQTFLTSEELGE